MEKAGPQDKIRWDRTKELFGAALDLGPELRSAFLREACGADEDLLIEIQSLLAAHIEDGSGPGDLSRNPWLSAFTDDRPAPDSVGPYRLIRKLGEGGMGQVWLAEQTEPVRRNVALKLIRSGLFSDGLLQRFNSERQSLAMMDHPSIARVFEAGSTPAGQPYLVMEYVPGLPITEFCDQKKLKVRERLELFIQACEGVQHAHQKAIIHRDLKPANILVMEVDGRPVPRIIDFGLAKAAGPSLTEDEMVTQEGTFIGTPGYMSPEQACASKLDSHCDLWALATVAYEALTAELPVPGVSTEELLRNLRARRLVPVHQRNAALPAGLNAFFERAFAPAIEQRFATASELAEGLEAALVTPPRNQRPAQRREVTRARLSLAALGAALLCIVGVTASAWRTAAVSPAAAAVNSAGSRRTPAADDTPSVLAPEPSSGVEARLPDPIAGRTERGVPPRREPTSRGTVDTRAAAPRTAPTPCALPPQPTPPAPTTPSRRPSAVPDAQRLVDRSTVL